jgi:LCP family protein required for cell wall assembly
VTVNVLTALALVLGGSAYAYLHWRLGQVKRVSVGGLAAQGSSVAPFTLLVIGSDTRSLGGGGGSQFGSSSQVSGQRSDSIILVRVVPKTRALALLSIPRDTLEPVPGFGITRVNAAFNSGNPSLLVAVLRQDFGIGVNHVVEFNFDTFRQVADAVGGVEQWFPTPAKDAYSLLEVPSAGCHNLSGDQALAFVRSREYQYELNGQWHYQLYPESDLARIQRQQAFVRDLVHKARRVAPTNLLELNSIIAGITRNLTLDKGFSDSLLLSLAADFRNGNLASIPSYTFPTVNSASVPGALDPEEAQGQQVIRRWLEVGQQAPSGTARAAPPTTVVTPAQSGTASVDPASSSFYEGVYVPPGLQRGQLPQTCGE